jgi:hypothetical protein
MRSAISTAFHSESKAKSRKIQGEPCEKSPESDGAIPRFSRPLPSKSPTSSLMTAFMMQTNGTSSSRWLTLRSDTSESQIFVLASAAADAGTEDRTSDGQ